MIGDCCTALRQQAAQALANSPHIEHQWTEDGHTLSPFFPASARDGFDVMVAAEADRCVVYVGRTHIHVDDLPTAQDTVQAALGLVRDLLSPDMRLRRAGLWPYRWYIEAYDGEKWQEEEQFGLLLPWTFFGGFSQRIYQNHTLPGRLSAAQAGDGSRATRSSEGEGRETE